MNRRAIFLGLLAIVGVKTQRAEGTSSRCVCGNRRFKHFTTRTLELVEPVKFMACTRCGLTYVEQLKLEDPTPS